jgi:L-fuculose-phosphate aldolase
MKMHLASYLQRPDVGAIIHAHPPFATAFAAAGLALDMPVLPEAILILGSVPLVEYGMPSTDEVPEKLTPYLPDHNVFLLANHGALVFGKNIKEASHRMETLELYAKVILMARILGGEKLLSAENLERLKKAFNLR